MGGTEAVSSCLTPNRSLAQQPTKEPSTFRRRERQVLTFVTALHTLVSRFFLSFFLLRPKLIFLYARKRAYLGSVLNPGLSCDELFDFALQSGLYYIQPDPGLQPFEVECEMVIMSKWNSTYIFCHGIRFRFF